MTNNEFLTMLQTARKNGFDCDTRYAFENITFTLMECCKNTGRLDLSKKLWDLYNEMEAINGCDADIIKAFERQV